MDGIFGEYPLLRFKAVFDELALFMVPSISWPNTDANAEAAESPPVVEAVIAAKVEANILFFSKLVKPPKKSEFIDEKELEVLYSC